MSDLDLLVIVKDADGNTKLLDSNGAAPDRPVGIQFSTQLSSGFTSAGWTLKHPIDRERPDLNLYDEVQIIGATGDIAYEGFVAEMPRSTGDSGHTLGVTTAGWVSHMTSEPFVMIFIDRDLSRWGDHSVAQSIALLAAGLNPDGGSLSVASDATGNQGLVSVRQGVMNKPINRYVYDAGAGCEIARLYVGSQTYGPTGLSGDTNVTTYALGWTDDAGSNQLITADQRTSTTIDWTLSSPRRYIVFDWLYNSTTGGTAGSDYSVRWQDVALYGDHNLSVLGTLPGGVAASDVIRWLIANYCPFLSADGVQDTTYPIAHLVFRDRTTVYDACLKVNAYHMWSLAVWEDRTVYYQPIDLTDWDWEIRHDEVGNTIGLQGDSTTTLRNGIIVQYTDLTGHTEELHPDDHSELLDTSLDNPATLHGRREYGTPFQIPYPTTAEGALELGRRQLLEDNAPKAPGSFTVRGRIRDRQGNWQPCWKVRAGDRIRLTSSVSLSDRPRLIGETSYTHDSQTVTIAVDGTMRTMDAYFERQQTALQAAGF